MAQELERRVAEQRKGPRRSAERGASDRRHSSRRAVAGVALVVASLTVGARTARADVYTRINSKGVLEATNVPANPQDFKLTYRSKGTLVHSAGFRMRLVEHGVRCPHRCRGGTAQRQPGSGAGHHPG